MAGLDPPGYNVTGFVIHSSDQAARRLELLHELLPAATSIAYLANPTNATVAAAEFGMTQIAANKFGVQLMVLNVSDPGLIEAAFVAAAKQRVDALLVSSDALFFTQRYQIIALAARHALPGIYFYRYRDAVVAGGLMSYGTDIDDVYHQVGRYTGRVLKVEKPADLPFQFATARLVINKKTAKALGLTFPLNLLGRADEVIE
jgi:putative tryptophan/tyrosine transport system substrate-binding protein